MPLTPSAPLPRMVMARGSTFGSERSSSSDCTTSKTCIDSSVVPATIA